MISTHGCLLRDPDLRGNVFKAKCNQPEQVANFATVDDIIKAQVGTEYDPFVVRSLEKEVDSGPKESAPVLKEDGKMTQIEGMKFKSKYNKYLNQVHQIKMQLKQTYPTYYGQIDEEMKESLNKDPELERVHQE